MLAMLRTSRRVLAGAFELLVLTSWLSVAAAACLGASTPASSMDAPMTVPTAMNHSSMGHHASESPASHSMTVHDDCPHCTTVEAPCMESSSDCDVPVAVMPVQPEQPDFTALLDDSAEIPARIQSARHFIPHASPPPRSGRDLHIFHCSFQE
jgi:hypothetical protein